MTEEKFDLWCMVELFGHQRIAGKCSEINVAGAIYAINPVTEEVARKLAENLEQKPITVYEVRQMFQKELQALNPKNNHQSDYNDEDELNF